MPFKTSTISFTIKQCRARLTALLIVSILLPALAQAQNRRPPRAKPPKFDKSEFDSVFFEDPKSTLKGELPNSQVKDSASPENTSSEGTDSASDDPLAWQNLASPESLEDLIKGTKLRLDRIITTPAAFSGGGFVVARREFSLLAVLFAIIEDYPKDVRWKASSPVARELMARMAANAKVGSIQSYNEAKKRMLDLGDLLNGSKLAGEAKTETDWSNLMDRTPLMQLLKWSQQDYINKHVASEANFKSNLGELKGYAEMVAILGKISLQEDMPDATDDDYKVFAQDMIKQAKQIAFAVETENAELARTAAGKLGQSCSNCHDNFR